MEGGTSQVGLGEFEGREADFSVEISARLIEQFCQLSGDFHPLHVDRAYAVKAGFLDVVAHGALIMAFGSRMIGMNIPGRRALLMSQKADFIAPAYPGDVLTYWGKIVRVRKSLAVATVIVAVLKADGVEVANIEYSVKIREP